MSPTEVLEFIAISDVSNRILREQAEKRSSEMNRGIGKRGY